jgi:hypothetical protein
MTVIYNARASLTLVMADEKTAGNHVTELPEHGTEITVLNVEVEVRDIYRILRKIFRDRIERRHGQCDRLKFVKKFIFLKLRSGNVGKWICGEEKEGIVTTYNFRPFLISGLSIFLFLGKIWKYNREPIPKD